MTPDALCWPLNSSERCSAPPIATDRHRSPSSAIECLECHRVPLSAADCLPHQVLTALFERLHTRDAEAAAREDALIELLREHGASLPAVLGAAPPARADYPQQFSQPEAEPAFAAD